MGITFEPPKTIKVENLKDRIEYLQQVKDLGDKYKNTLGFFPSKAFDEYAEQGSIIIVHNGDAIFGYLLYRYVKQTNSYAIVHLCVESSYRGNGVSNLLLNYLKRVACNVNGISLYCRQDYKLAGFWQKHLFVPIGTKPGRLKSGSVLVRWWYENPDKSKLDQLSLWDISSKEFNTVVVLDMNIVNDLNNNGKHSDEARALLDGWIDNVDYRVTKEVYNEISRKDDEDERKRFTNYISFFNTVNVLDRDFHAALSNIEVLLPGNSASKISDRRQLAHSVASGSDYFITRDKQIRSRASEFESIFGLKVCRPAEFILEVHKDVNKSSYRPSVLAGTDCEKRLVNSDDYSSLFEYFSVDGEKKSIFENSVAKYLVDKANSKAEVYTINNIPNVFYVSNVVDNNHLEIPFLRIKGTEHSITLLYKVISSIIKDCLDLGLESVIINDEHALKYIEIIDVLEELKFMVKDEGYSKNSIRQIFPNKEAASEYLESNNKLSSHLLGKNSYDLEHILSPAKILDESIDNFIIAIEPHWAKELFDEHVASLDLFGATDLPLIFNYKNVYYRSKNTCGLNKQSRILWYLKKRKLNPYSGGIVATSMLDNIDIGKPKALYKKYSHLGVYKWKDIYEMCGRDVDKDIMAISFINTELFTARVSYEDVCDMLKEEGVTSNNFQSPLKVPDIIFEQLYRLGMSKGGKN